MKLFWQPIARVDEIEDEHGIHRPFKGGALLIFRNGDAIHVVDGRCPHQGSRLGEGLVAGCLVVCPSHGWAFDVRNGRNRTRKGAPLRVHASRVIDGVIYLRRF